MSRLWYSLPLCSLVAVTVLSTTPTIVVADNLGAIQLDAQPSLIKADGRSSTVITAQVYDDHGNLVPDGTRVRFTTTAGSLSADVAATQNGVARVTLTSAEQPGTATIIAVLETPGKAVPTRIIVTFSKDVEAADTRIAYIRIDGTQYIGYAAERGIVQASGKNSGASLSYRSLTIRADTLQFNVRMNQLLAIGDVRLTASGHEQRYDHLVLALMNGTGLAEKIEDGHITAFNLKGTKFEPTPYETGRALPPTSAFALTDISDAGITVVCRGLMIEPGKRLQFRRATFYVDGTKAYSMPLHVMSLNQDSIFPEQLIGYGDQGLMVDFPFYYQADPTGIGTLHFRRAARVSSSAYSIRPGWELDMTQNYFGPRNTTGTFELNGLTRSDWGMRLTHAQTLAPDTTGNLFVDFPNHRSLFVNTQATQSFKTFSLNSLISGTRSPGYTDVVTNKSTTAVGDFHEQIYADTYDRSFWHSKQVRYSLNAGLSQQNFYGQIPIPGQPKPVSSVGTESFGGRLSTVPLQVMSQTTLRQSVSLGQAWVQGVSGTGYAHSGVTLLGTTTLSRRLGTVGAVDLSYDYTQTPLTTGVSNVTVSGKQRLGLGSNLSGHGWDFSLSGSRGLDVDQASLVSTLQVRLGPRWRARATASASRFSGLTYQEVEYSLIRNIANRDFAVYYSTTSRRFQLDLTGARF